MRAAATFAVPTGPLLAAACLRDAPPPDHTAVFGGGAGERVDLSRSLAVRG